MIYKYHICWIMLMVYSTTYGKIVDSVLIIAIYIYFILVYQHVFDWTWLKNIEH